MITLDETLTAELDAFGEMYWRWAVRDDALASLVNKLSSGMSSVLAALAPEGTDGAAFAAFVQEAFADTRPDKSLTACVALALLPLWRSRWDATWIVCDYGPAEERATRITVSGEPLCADHAREHFGADWRTDTLKLTAAVAARYGC